MCGVSWYCDRDYVYFQVFQIKVNSEIFARVYFRETLRTRSLVKIKPSRNGEITLSFTDVGKPGPSHGFLKTSQICL